MREVEITRTAIPRTGHRIVIVIAINPLKIEVYRCDRRRTRRTRRYGIVAQPSTFCRAISRRRSILVDISRVPHCHTSALTGWCPQAHPHQPLTGDILHPVKIETNQCRSSSTLTENVVAHNPKVIKRIEPNRDKPRRTVRSQCSRRCWPRRSSRSRSC